MNLRNALEIICLTLGCVVLFQYAIMNHINLSEFLYQCFGEGKDEK